MRSAILLALSLTACAEAPIQAAVGSVVPGTIGMVVRHHGAELVVADMGKHSPAAESGVRVGDVIVRFNGEPVTSPRHFNRLVLDSAPGSVVRLEVRRQGALRVLDIPVEQLDTLPGV